MSADAVPQAKFTPGPWINDDGRIYGSDGYFICDIAPNNAAISEQDMFNAPLLAAAPDLLEALRDSLAQHHLSLSYLHHRRDKEGEPVNDWIEDEEAIINKIEAAIAKATGQEGR